MPVPNVPIFTQAEYIERCIWLLEAGDLNLISRYRHASTEDKTRMLHQLIGNPQYNDLLCPPECDENIESTIAWCTTQPEPIQMFDAELLNSYLRARRYTPIIVKSAHEKKVIYDDTRFELSDPDSEEWKVFCTLKSRVDDAYAHALDQVKRLCEVTQRIMANFISFSNGGEDVLKPAQGYTREGNDGIYLHFRGLTAEEGGESPSKPFTEEQWKKFLAPLGHNHV